MDVYGKIAWKDGKLIFRNASLEEILKRLERHFNVEIQFNNRSGKEYKYRATFRTETLSQILDYLARSADLKWKIEEPQQQADDTLSKTKIRVVTLKIKAHGITQENKRKEESCYQQLSSSEFSRFTVQGLANTSRNQTIVHLVINFS